MYVNFNIGHQFTFFSNETKEKTHDMHKKRETKTFSNTQKYMPKKKSCHGRGHILQSTVYWRGVEKREQNDVWRWKDNESFKQKSRGVKKILRIRSNRGLSAILDLLQSNYASLFSFGISEYASSFDTTRLRHLFKVELLVYLQTDGSRTWYFFKLLKKPLFYNFKLQLRIWRGWEKVGHGRDWKKRLK